MTIPGSLERHHPDSRGGGFRYAEGDLLAGITGEEPPLRPALRPENFSQEQWAKIQARRKAVTQGVFSKHIEKLLTDMEEAVRALATRLGEAENRIAAIEHQVAAHEHQVADLKAMRDADRADTAAAIRAIVDRMENLESREVPSSRRPASQGGGT